MDGQCQHIAALLQLLQSPSTAVQARVRVELEACADAPTFPRALATIFASRDLVLPAPAALPVGVEVEGHALLLHEVEELVDAAALDRLLAIYETGVERIIEEFSKAVFPVDKPWERLGVAISAHVGAITRQTPYMRVINRVLPEHVSKHAAALSCLRRRYEDCFRDLIDGLPLAPHVDRSLLRLMVLGAVNHTQFWFEPDGKRTPSEVGDAFARLLVEPIAAPRKPTSSPNRKACK